MVLTQVVDGQEMFYPEDGGQVVSHVRNTEDPNILGEDHAGESKVVEELRAQVNDLLGRIKLLEQYVLFEVTSVEKDLIKLNNKLFNINPHWHVDLHINIDDSKNKFTCRFKDSQYHCGDAECKICMKYKSHGYAHYLLDNPVNDQEQVQFYENTVKGHLWRTKWGSVNFEYLKRDKWVHEYRMSDKKGIYPRRIYGETRHRIDPIIKAMLDKKMCVSKRRDAQSYYLRLGSSYISA